MRSNLALSIIISILVHALIVVLLVVNIDFSKPEKPKDISQNLIKAKVIDPTKLPSNGRRGAQLKKADKQKEQALIAQKKAKKQEELKRQREAKIKERLAQEKKRVEEKKAAQKRIALEKKKKAELEKKRLEEEKKKKVELEKKRLEAEKKKKAELEKKRLEAEKKKKAELEKKRLEEEKRKKAQEEKKRLEEEKKKKALEEAKKKKALEEQKKRALEKELADAENDIIDELLPEGKGPANGSNQAVEEAMRYGALVKANIEENWRIDPQMVGKKVTVSIEIKPNGTIFNEECSGNKQVCESALRAVEFIGTLPPPPPTCTDCKKIILTMTPHL